MAMNTIEAIQPLQMTVASPRTGTMNHPVGGDLVTPAESRASQSGIVVSQSHASAGRLNDYKNRLNQAAVNIRQVDQRLEKIETYADQMKTNLIRFTKSFPPFLPGSEERVRMLKSYVAFRKQINRLTIPPREEFQAYAPVQLANPAEKQNGGDQVEIRPEAVVINGHRIYTDLPVFDLPTLSDKDGDDQLESIVPKLEALTSAVVQRREKLFADVHETSFYTFPDGGISETAAIISSREISRELSKFSETSLTSNPSYLRDALRQYAA